MCSSFYDHFFIEKMLSLRVTWGGGIWVSREMKQISAKDLRDKNNTRRRCNKKNKYLTTSMLHDTLYPERNSWNDLFSVILFSSGRRSMWLNLKLTPTSEVKKWRSYLGDKCLWKVIIVEAPFTGHSRKRTTVLAVVFTNSFSTPIKTL